MSLKSLCFATALLAATASPAFAQTADLDSLGVNAATASTPALVESCTLPLPDGAVVYHFAAMSGLFVALDELPNSMTGITSRTDIVVTETEAPVALVLTALDATEWRVGLAEGVELAGVFVMGVADQSVKGLSKDVPVLITTAQAPVPSCVAKGLGYAGIHNLNAPSLAQQQAVARIKSRLFTEQPTSEPPYAAYYARSAGEMGQEEAGRTFEIPKREELAYSDDRGRVFPPEGLPPGQEGLTRLLQAGKLRLATAEDIQAWDGAARPVTNSLGLSVKQENQMIEGETYVILEPTELPAGFGAFNIYYILGTGVPRPTARGTAAYIYEMDSGECRIAGLNRLCPQ